jgi:hypothetical protein
MFSDFVGREVGWPAVGGGDGCVERAVGEVEPSGALVEEVCEGAFGELDGSNLHTCSRGSCYIIIIAVYAKN